jgi:hypothetical protein
VRPCRACDCGASQRARDEGKREGRSIVQYCCTAVRWDSIAIAVAVEASGSLSIGRRNVKSGRRVLCLRGVRVQLVRVRWCVYSELSERVVAA